MVALVLLGLAAAAPGALPILLNQGLEARSEPHETMLKGSFANFEKELTSARVSPPTMELKPAPGDPSIKGTTMLESNFDKFEKELTSARVGGPIKSKSRGAPSIKGNYDYHFRANFNRKVSCKSASLDLRCVCGSSSGPSRTREATTKSQKGAWCGR